MVSPIIYQEMHGNINIILGRSKCFGYRVRTTNTYHYATLNSRNSSKSASLFTNTSSVPLQEHVGLRQLYYFGLYSYCAYVNVTAGSCSHTKVATKFLPYDVISADVAVGHLSSPTPDTIVLSASIGSQSRSAYYLILLGFICTALALFTWVFSPSIIMKLIIILPQRSCETC